MSTVRAIEKSGAVAFDSAIRRLTVCCSLVSSCTSAWPLAPASPRCGSGARCSGCSAGAATGAASPLSAAACTSAFTIRPPGPEPSSRASSTPSSRAMRRATGEAFTRPPSPFPPPVLGARSLVAVWVTASAGAARSEGCSAGSAFAAGCPFPAGASPGSPMRAISSPIASVSPSCATTSISVPSASAS